MPASYVKSLISLHELGYHGNGRLPSLFLIPVVFGDDECSQTGKYTQQIQGRMKRLKRKSRLIMRERGMAKRKEQMTVWVCTKLQI